MCIRDRETSLHCESYRCDSWRSFEWKICHTENTRQYSYKGQAIVNQIVVILDDCFSIELFDTSQLIINKYTTICWLTHSQGHARVCFSHVSLERLHIKLFVASSAVYVGFPTTTPINKQKHNHMLTHTSTRPFEFRKQMFIVNHIVVILDDR